jgi:hypothetical protein
MKRAEHKNLTQYAACNKLNALNTRTSLTMLRATNETRWTHEPEMCTKFHFVLTTNTVQKLLVEFNTTDWYMNNGTRTGLSRVTQNLVCLL